MSGSWTSGYMAEVEYTYGFYKEQTPAVLNWALLARAQSIPSLDEKLAYCELGCGQGVTTNVLAAANPNIEFYATDFNPSHIAGARALAQAAGTPNVHFYDQSFQQFIDNPDLPKFDFITLHGIYSWISPENRGAIVRFIDRHLKPGGVVYNSYNTLPGWAHIMPLRQLLAQQAGNRKGPVVPRVEQAIDFANRLLEAEARYFVANPTLKDRMELLKKQPRAYVAHEYLNESWTPFYFTEVAAEMSEARLTWAASANIIDNVDAVALLPKHKEILAEIGDPVQHESVRDYLINQQFRRDIFVRGPRTLSVLELNDLQLATRFVLAANAADVSMTITAPVGQVKLQEEAYRPLLAAMEQGVLSVGELLTNPGMAEMGGGRILQALAVLTGAGYVYPALPASGDARRRVQTDAFNAEVLARARYGAELSYLASPVTGSGHACDRFHMLYLNAMRDGVDAVEYTWNCMNRLNQRLVTKDGKTLQTKEENVVELRTRTAEFQAKTLPILKRLGIA